MQIRMLPTKTVFTNTGAESDNIGNTCNPVKQKVEGGQQCGLSSEILTKKKHGRRRGGEEEGRKANRHELRAAPDE